MRSPRRAAACAHILDRRGKVVTREVAHDPDRSPDAARLLARSSSELKGDLEVATLVAELVPRRQLRTEVVRAAKLLLAGTQVQHASGSVDHLRMYERLSVSVRVERVRGRPWLRPATLSFGDRLRWVPRAIGMPVCLELIGEDECKRRGVAGELLGAVGRIRGRIDVLKHVAGSVRHCRRSAALDAVAARAHDREADDHHL